MPSFGATTPIMGDGWVQLAGPDSPKIPLDQLSQADQELIVQFLVSSQFPSLSPPQNSEHVSSDSLSVQATAAAMVSVKQQDIITDMLDKWLVSIQEQKRISEDAAKQKDIDNMAIAYSTFRHQQDLQGDTNFPLFTVGLVIVGTGALGGGVSQAMLPNPTDSPVSFNPVNDMYAKALPSNAIDVQAQLTLVGTIYATGIQYLTVAELAAKSAETNLKPKDGDFAKGYAQNVISLIGNPGFNNYLSAIVTLQYEAGKPINEKEAKGLVSMVKVVLLASALAMLYKAEAGKMTSIEFAAMLDGKITFSEGDIRNTLIAHIRTNLSLMSPAMRENAMKALSEYFDSDPSIEALSDPAKVFGGIYSNLPRVDLKG